MRPPDYGSAAAVEASIYNPDIREERVKWQRGRVLQLKNKESERCW
jgi:hypothetical protein